MKEQDGPNKLRAIARQAMTDRGLEPEPAPRRSRFQGPGGLSGAAS